MKQIQFRYNNLLYNFVYNQEDASGLGCIKEIVKNNEYRLDEFVNLDKKYILDIGGNCGVATIILAKQNPTSKIIVLEPFNKCFNLIKKNVELNNLKNVIMINKALAFNNNLTPIHVLHRMSGASTIFGDSDKWLEKYPDHTGGKVDIEYCECITLDSLCEEYNITSIELLKIDCEGGEFCLLESNVVKNGIIKNIVGEFHDLTYNTDKAQGSDKLVEHCKKYIKGKFIVSILKL